MKNWLNYRKYLATISRGLCEFVFVGHKFLPRSKNRLLPYSRLIPFVMTTVAAMYLCVAAAAADGAAVALPTKCEDYPAFVQKACTGNMFKGQVVQMGTGAVDGMQDAGALSGTAHTAGGAYNINNARVCTSVIGDCNRTCNAEAKGKKEEKKAALMAHAEACSEMEIYAAASAFQGLSNLAGIAKAAESLAASTGGDEGGTPDLPGGSLLGGGNKLGGLKNLIGGGPDLELNNGPGGVTNDGPDDTTPKNNFKILDNLGRTSPEGVIVGNNSGFKTDDEALGECLDPASSALPTCFAKINEYCGKNGTKSICSEFCKQNFTASACQGGSGGKNKKSIYQAGAGAGGGSGGGAKGLKGAGKAGAKDKTGKGILIAKKDLKKDPFGGLTDGGGGGSGGGGYKSSYRSRRLKPLNLSKFGLGKKKKPKGRGATGSGRSLAALDPTITGPRGISIWDKIHNRYSDYCRRKKFISCKKK